jgi:hypothetical protein
MQLFEPDRSVRNKAQLIWTALWVFCTVIAVRLSANPDGHGTHQQLGLPPCPSVLMFDRPCPGCGLTTSWTATVHGQLIHAFHAHPLGTFMYLSLTILGIGCLYGNIVGKRMLIDTPIASRIFVGFVIVFFVVGLTRMALTKNYASTKAEILLRESMKSKQR